MSFKLIWLSVKYIYDTNTILNVHHQRRVKGISEINRKKKCIRQSSSLAEITNELQRKNTSEENAYITQKSRTRSFRFSLVNIKNSETCKQIRFGNYLN